MQPIILVAETGSDITPELAAQYHIQIVPMHVAFDGKTLDDGAFPVQKICDYYQQTGKLPTASGSTPDDFERVCQKSAGSIGRTPVIYLSYSIQGLCNLFESVQVIRSKAASKGNGRQVLHIAKANAFFHPLVQKLIYPETFDFDCHLMDCEIQLPVCYLQSKASPQRFLSVQNRCR